MYYWNDGGIDERRCPVCGKERPCDWFVGEDGACWRCRERVRSDRSAEAQRDEPKGAGYELIG